MGFIERIVSLAQNNISKIEGNSNLLTPFAANSLKRNNLKEDAYQSSKSVEAQGRLPKNYEYATPVEGNVFIDNLSLNDPEKFISLYANTATLQQALEENPEIERILKENDLPVDFYLDNITSIVHSHLLPTAQMAQKVYKNIGSDVNEKEYIYLTQAALLHDIGKAFIPPEILNKHGFLTPKERRIVELHNRLSYEILRTTNLSSNVAKLALEHHNYDGKVKQSPENQALTVADVYCALREQRPYKKPMNDITAKTIMYDMGTKGKFDTRYICKLNS